MLIRFLLFVVLALFVLRSLWRLFEGIVEGATGTRRSGGQSRVPQRGAPMVRDPICGTFVVQSRARNATRGNEQAFFCSDECRRAWLSGAQPRSEPRAAERGA
jgi:YHS domain-containing protein